MKNLAIFVIAITVLIVALFTILNKPTSPQTALPTATTLSPSPIINNEKVNITASFNIITDKITRSFKAEKYQNLSPDVFIPSDNPSIVYVKKAGITWNDFFKTLPMKLTKECLTTGDGETFCDSKQGTLKFYLNDIETPNLLGEEIKNGDKALIKFTSY